MLGIGLLAAVVTVSLVCALICAFNCGRRYRSFQPPRDLYEAAEALRNAERKDSSRRMTLQ